MARIRTFGLCAIAVVALALTSAGSASAEAPEFGRCVKVATGTGVYSTATCTAEGGEKKFVWIPGIGSKTKFSEKVFAEKAFKWKLAGNDEGICVEEAATGEYTSPKTVGNVRITLNSCGWKGGPTGCGPIVLEPMRGELGVYELGETPLTNKIGLKLEPEAGNMIAAFNCETSTPPNPFTWQNGWVIGAVTTNKMLIKNTVKYKYRKPSSFGIEQLPQGFLGELPNPMESSTALIHGEEKEFQALGWQLTTKMNNEEKIEVSSTL
jgi:hypothetical protein